MTGRLLRLLWLGGFLAMLALATGCAPIRYDHDLVGKVVDSETGKPIPGTVILAKWEKYYNTLAGGHGEFYDAQETVADENGEFRIRGRGLRLFTVVETAMAYVFKAGYDWVVIDYERLQQNRGIVKLLKIDKKTMEDRMPPIPDAHHEKIVEYIREMDKVLIQLGYDTYFPPNDTK